MLITCTYKHFCCDIVVNSLTLLRPAAL